MTNIQRTLAAAALATGFAFGAHAEPAEPVRNIVIVHGAFADGSGWRGVYEELTGRGYAVSIVQNPLTSFADDVAATRRVLDRQDGPVTLVGHSYGGSVITEAGAIAPELLRRTARRIGAETTEAPGSHVVFLTQPKAVAGVIDAAPRGAAEIGEATGSAAALASPE